MDSLDNITVPGESEDSGNNISSIVNIFFLTPSNAEFSMTENGFLQLKATLPNPEKDNKIETIQFERVFLHRAFPFDMPYEYISVFGAIPKPPQENDDGKEKDKENSQGKENVTYLGELREIGMIKNINIFSDIMRHALEISLNSKYFTSVIQFIYSIKDKYGYSYWEVKTNVGKVKFTVHDTYKSLLKVTADRIIVNDINGNRYEIPSLAKFDKSSFRKIELFL
jgi:hypothetical protein